MDVRSENLALAASAVEDAIRELKLDPVLREQTDKLHKALTEFRRGRNEEEEKYFQAAKEEYEEGGELEFDDDAIVSISDDGGAYVSAWKWVTVALVGFSLAVGAVATERALYKTHRLSVADVAVSCADASKPAVQEVATDQRVIIVSCPFSAEEKAPRGASR